MYKKKYRLLAILNFIFGACAIALYLPYTFEAFNIKGMGWLNFAPDLFKSNYFDVLIYFGIFLLVWFIVTNALSLLSYVNMPKLAFKISIISALILPLIYVMALKFDFMLEFWIKSIAPNIKMISYIFACIAVGSFILGLVLNFTKENRANLHHILQALVMSILLILLIAVNGWCGWSIGLSALLKLFGVLMGLFATYLPISSIVLFVCAKKRY